MKRERGNVFVIVLVLMALVVGAWQFSEYRSRQKQHAAAEAEKIRVDAARKEREELERREAAAKAVEDALQGALKKVDDLSSRWADAARVAGATSRIALSGPVSNLQSLRREAKELTVPPCLDTGKEALLQSMDLTLEAYMTFMVQKDKVGELLANALFEKATEAMKGFSDARASCPA